MILAIGIGGVIGATLRFYLGRWISAKTANHFPYGTWLINITGSLILGWLVSSYMNNQLSEWLWAMAGIGFCGSYTTFSTFGFETLQLLEDKRYFSALLYVLSSLILSLMAAWLGFFLGF